MISVKFIQFLRPNGRQQPITIELEDSVASKVQEIQQCGLTLTAEVLMNGLCSFAIEEKEFGDFDMELSPNGPEVPVRITKMLMRFDKAKFEQWKKRQQDDLEGEEEI
jgi:hypothetical protein